MASDLENFIAGFAQQQLSSQGLLGQTLEDQAQKRKNKLQLALESARTEQELSKRERELALEQQSKLIPQEQQQALIQAASTGQMVPGAPQPTTPLGQERQFQVAQDIGKGKREKQLAGIKANKEKAPQGYRYTPTGDLEAIPGGPADAKLKEKQQTERFKQALKVDKLNTLSRHASEAKKAVSNISAGLGSLTKGIPLTPAKNLDAKLESLRAAISFSELAEMREASKTGGALGQIAVRELDLLAAARGSLDQAQSPSQLKNTIEEIEKRTKTSLKAIELLAEGGDLPLPKQDPFAGMSTQEKMSLLMQRFSNKQKQNGKQ